MWVCQGVSKMESYQLWNGKATNDGSFIRELLSVKQSKPKISKYLHVETPLLYSQKISHMRNLDVWLKLENLQPTESFKMRGLGTLCQRAQANGCKHFYCSSGGNAGLAAVYCASKLDLPITVVVPETTTAFVVEWLRKQGADVVIHGKAWDDADKLTRELVEKDPKGTYMPPFDHPDVWDGHSTIVHEIKSQLQECKPDLIVVALGGGGLLCGVLQGLHEVGWGDIPVVAMETFGADSLAECCRQNKWTEIPAITSVAKCLGARRVTEKAFQWMPNHPVTSVVVQDKEAVSACLKFANDHKMLVEPACGAALSAVYSDEVLTRLQENGMIPKTTEKVVVIVCGGSGVSLNLLQQWKSQFNL